MSFSNLIQQAVRQRWGWAVCRQLLLETMAATTVADGKVTEEEVNTLAVAYEDVMHAPASQDTVRQLLRNAADGLQVALLPLLQSSHPTASSAGGLYGLSVDGARVGAGGGGGGGVSSPLSC